ncbi:receptor-like protein kinase FERONIA [Vigna radiata var. radiata]|uniref:Receptor-like protein kinase FERONIA n=1 Tax=Vigna radiata var. radiata TaxID=3916 RepID=A0A1S3TSX3_VIGRR|nr:receptor-like protein kinase FERONIA [Vigna radiata var. radiata]
MGTTYRPIALRNMLFFLLSLCHPYFSIADVIYRPVELFTVNCGSAINFTLDGRNWTGDSNTKFLSESKDSVTVQADTQSTIQGPYTYARLSHFQFTYSFPVTTQGPFFLRLFFYSTSYQMFDRHKANFSVQAGPYTLLQHFNPSLYAEADDDPTHSDILFREYCIYLQHDQRLDITFAPSTTESYAFINGIEIVSMPSYLYYSNPNYTVPDDITKLPQFVGHNQVYIITNNSALETKHRLKVGGAQISPSQDTGMLRTWDTDDKYLITDSGPSTDYAKKTNLSFVQIPNYTAPDQVYRSVRNIGMNPFKNLTWQLPVYSGFFYLLRLHFCQLNPEVQDPGDQMFYIFIQDQLAERGADILKWSDNQKGVPVVKDYAVYIPGNREKVYLSLEMHPNSMSSIQDAQLNAIEVFKINDTTGSLAEPNPDPPPQTTNKQISKKKNSGTKRPLTAAVAGAVFAVVLLSFMVVFFIKNLKQNVAVYKNQKDGTSRGGGSGSSSLPTNLCRHFSIAEIRAATNNFDQLFVVGAGGFGDVYKGYIDDGSTPVAIKRLKPGSQQGLNEFMNEIQMLSQLRHLHLVSLIGYCYESNEMILIYDFMERGTLRDHLYGTDSPPLSWTQRLQICIGAARGLHYLHTGAKQMIIHRDVKSTNILLDEKWVAKVSDFGLSRIGPTGSSMTHVSTKVKGSVGYLDPEYYKRQRLTEKSDVYSYGVVLLEVLCGRQPLLRTAEKQQVSLVNWAKHRYEKGFLSEIVDPALKGQIAPHCLRKFSEVALSCLLEDGNQRPSMNVVVGVLEFVMQLQLQDGANVNVVLESGGDYEDSTTEDMFSGSHSSMHVSDFSNSSGLNSTSYASQESDRLISELVFSEINHPKGR